MLPLFPLPPSPFHHSMRTRGCYPRPPPPATPPFRSRHEGVMHYIHPPAPEDEFTTLLTIEGHSPAMYWGGVLRWRRVGKDRIVQLISPCATWNHHNYSSGSICAEKGPLRISSLQGVVGIAAPYSLATAIYGTQYKMVWLASLRGNDTRRHTVLHNQKANIHSTMHHIGVHSSVRRPTIWTAPLHRKSECQLGTNWLEGIGTI